MVLGLNCKGQLARIARHPQGKHDGSNWLAPLGSRICLAAFSSDGGYLLCLKCGTPLVYFSLSSVPRAAHKSDGVQSNLLRRQACLEK